MDKNQILNKILGLVREEMAAPTGNTGSAPGKPGLSSKADAKGPMAGYDKPLKKKKRYIWTRGIRKNWKKKGES